jgi:hypothetical protein
VKREEPLLAERKMVRRGLLGALAGLGAAGLMTVTGAKKAQAIHQPEDVGLGLVNPGNGQAVNGTTRIDANTFVGAGLYVANADFSTYASQTGVTALTNGTGFGVLGRNDNASGVGVKGISGGLGVGGEGLLTGSVGVRGASINNGTGVRGVSNTNQLDSNGTGSGIGVQGRSTGGPGIEGISVNSLGVRGTSTNFVGVVGISTNNHGLYGSSGHANAVGLVGENTGGGLAGYFYGGVLVSGNFGVFGAKNAIIKMADGSHASVYCQESPEPYFEDFGRAQLVGGVANVPLERDFATLATGADYMVFLTPEGPSGGLYVSRRGPQGFEVKDPGNGNVSFTYRVVTRRRDIEGKRFARVSDNVAKGLAASRAALGISGGPTGNTPGSNPAPPVR